MFDVHVQSTEDELYRVDLLNRRVVRVCRVELYLTDIRHKR